MIEARISLGQFLDDERGTATIEFLGTFPLLMTVFLASFEASFYTVRHVLLERSVDMVMRELRLGILGVSVTHAFLKDEICDGAIASLVTEDDCDNNLKIWLQPISTVTFSMPTVPASCIDRSQPIDPLLQPPPDEFATGSGGELMLVRVCLKADPMFGIATAVGAGLVRDSDDGGYQLVATSIFVNEPG